MPVSLPTPWFESRAMPDYQALLAVDAKDFTGLPAMLHAPTSQTISELVNYAFDGSVLQGLRKTKAFPANTGDGVLFGFSPSRLPFVIHPFLDLLEKELARYNAESKTRLRLRASVHVGPLPHDGNPSDGKGAARNETHRLLDSQQIKAILADTDEEATHLAAIISQRVYEDAVLGGYTGLAPQRFVEVTATVDNKNFAQRAWLYVPAPSGGLLCTGVRGGGDLPEQPVEKERSGAAEPRYLCNLQRVRDGLALMGDIAGSVHYMGDSPGQGAERRRSHGFAKTILTGRGPEGEGGLETWR